MKDKQYGYLSQNGDESYGFRSEAEAVRQALLDNEPDAEMTFDGLATGVTAQFAAEEVGLGYDATGIFYWPSALTEILEDNFDNVELWHTGGGCMNPVIVFERNGDHATRYIMFSDGWHQAEASFGYYDETVGDDWDEGTQADFRSVPMTPEGIVALVQEFINTVVVVDDGYRS